MSGHGNVCFALGPSQNSTTEQQVKIVGDTVRHYFLTKMQQSFPTAEQSQQSHISKKAHVKNNE